ncbi:hypothetical protein [Streptomyces sp. WG7]|uniref:AbiTii domain-containing protein n=1 Tax=Streptomyces sp. WG7 TaxID=3417650 RepID=UPI003CEF3B55
MNRRERTLLAQIKQDVLDDTKPLAGALRRCVVLGGHTGSAALRDWAQRELRGYDGVDLADVPSHRVVVAPGAHRSGAVVRPGPSGALHSVRSGAREWCAPGGCGAVEWSGAGWGQ